ncbi:hypothetical protein J7S50_20100 [Providencia rettgeri]|nr:hypothetical protein [Providencia rettgeri]
MTMGKIFTRIPKSVWGWVK